jgi:hypothetical protein
VSMSAFEESARGLAHSKNWRSFARAGLASALTPAYVFVNCFPSHPAQSPTSHFPCCRTLEA